MIYHQSINIPVLIESIDLSSLDLRAFFQAYNLDFKSILVLAGKKISAGYAKDLIDRNSACARFVLTCDVQNEVSFVEEYSLYTDFNTIDLIIGIGGGKVLDTAKYMAAKNQINYIAIPTIISNDGAASPISVLNASEREVSLPARTPMGILIDYDVIKTSDRYHTLSGIGDIISNMSAIHDWDLAIRKGKARANNFARLLAQSAVANVLPLKLDVENRNFLECFVNAIIMCGLAMNISGDSRPCSGAEHLLAHTLRQQRLSNESHGFLVGSLTPLALWLHRQKDHAVFEYIIRNRFEYRIENLLSRPVELRDIFESARSIRGNRYTILSEFTNEQLCKEYDSFIGHMNEISDFI
ncbi:MAG: iron-containing alcohol dehydrogenase [Spartobacteria bacterium]|nr:iron-containing alcohol dehydrogenase [Spartobacteria bacterium]